MARNNRFTIYDAMEAKGVFDANPANIQSRDNNGLSMYAGPQEYPKMLYHPEGLEKVVQPAEAISTPFGPKLVGEQKRLESMIVNNREEELKAVKEGWHTRPRDAIKARAQKEGIAFEEIPESVHETELEKLRKQLQEAQLKNTEMELQLAAKGNPVGIVKK